MLRSREKRKYRSRSAIVKEEADIALACQRTSVDQAIDTIFGSYLSKLYREGPSRQILHH